MMIFLNNLGAIKTFEISQNVSQTAVIAIRSSGNAMMLPNIIAYVETTVNITDNDKFPNNGEDVSSLRRKRAPTEREMGKCKPRKNIIAHVFDGRSWFSEHQ